MKRTLCSLLLALCLLLGGTQLSALAQDAPIEIVVWKKMFETWNQQFFLDCAEAYNNENRGYRVTVEIVAESGFDDLMNAARATGTAPDIFDVNHNYVQSTAKRQEILPLNGLMSEEAIADVSDTLRGVLSLDGQLYGYPQFMEFSNVLFYRTDLLEAAGYDHAPATWDELLDAAVKMTTNDIFGLALPSWGEMTWTTWGWMMQSGHLALTDNWDAPNIKDFRDFALFLKEAYETEAVPQEKLCGFADIGAFARGEVAMALSGSWGVGNVINDYPEVADKFAISPCPTKDGQPAPTTCYGGYSFMIDAKSAHPEGAADFLEWMLHNGERMAVFFELAQFGKAPGTVSCAAFLADKYPDSPFIETLNTVGATAQSEPLYPWDITMVTGAMFENVAAGRMDVDEAIRQAEENIQQIIDSQKLAGKNPDYQPE